jgi:hypothetical protein
VLLEHRELSSAALAELVDTDRRQVLVSLRVLEARGRVVRVGQRRGTRWRAITDEERIQQRAAELEALRVRRGSSDPLTPGVIAALPQADRPPDPAPPAAPASGHPQRPAADAAR